MSRLPLRSKFVPPAAVLALCGLATVAVMRRSPESARAEAEAPTEGLSLRCPVGESRTYRFEMETTQSARLLEAEQRGHLTLAGLVELRCHGEGPQGTAVGVRFGEFETARLEVAGQAALTPAATRALIGPEAVATLDAQGRFAGWQAPAEAPALFGHLSRGVFMELAVSLDADPGALTWSATAPTALGLVAVDYTRLPEAGDGAARVERRPSGFERLDALPPGAATDRIKVDVDGEARAEIAAGRVRTLAGTTSVQAFAADGRTLLDVTTRADFTLTAVGRFDPAGARAALAALSPALPADLPAADPALERRLLEARVDGLTFDGLTDDLLEFANGGAMPDHNRWLWRATGLLIAEPARCRELVPLFEDPHLTQEARALLLDLLANAGHADAQAALRAALDGETARTVPEAAALYQRVALLEAPDAETLAWALERHVEAPEALAGATAVSLGAVTGLRARQGDADGAAAANGALLRTVAAAREPAAREVAVLALGNAGLPQNQVHLERLAADPDPGVRAAVATALRKTATPEARATLLGLLGDAEATVQRAAGKVLGTQTLDDETMTVLAARIAGGEIGDAAWPGLLTALAQRPDEPAARIVYAAMLRRPGLDPLLAERIRGLLGS
jgi:hypothetical protein